MLVSMEEELLPADKMDNGQQDHTVFTMVVILTFSSFIIVLKINCPGTVEASDISGILQFR